MVANYSKGGYPLETVWLDIPYMDKYTDFTVDAKNWSNIGTFADTLAARHQHMVPILDAGISAENPKDEFYMKALETGALIRSTMGDLEKDYHGYAVLKVWPTACVFPDWFNETSYDFWEYGLNKLYNNKLKFSGLWLDMNEPTGFCNGECPHYKEPKNPHPPLICPSKEAVPKIFLLGPRLLEEEQHWYCSFPDQSKNSTYFVPFDGGFQRAGFLDNMTLSLNATNYDSRAKKTYQQYNTHSLFGLMQTNATYRWMTESKGYAHTDQRPFILSRSTFASSGRFTQHWLGDNHREWSYMRYSIAGIMNMNMFGIPMVGADVCGFFGNRSDEMCGRWMQLAAF